MAERNELKRRRIMREFTINELSSVDNSAQAGAVLMKRATNSRSRT